MERQLAGCVAENPRTTLKTLANDLAKSGTEVSGKIVVRAQHRNGTPWMWNTKDSTIELFHLVR